MPADDGWDWPILLYVGTVILKRSEGAFWTMTPRKFNALLSAHAKINNPEEADGTTATSSKPQSGFIDQVI